jgi:hypothetical protein
MKLYMRHHMTSDTKYEIHVFQELNQYVNNLQNHTRLPHSLVMLEVMASKDERMRPRQAEAGLRQELLAKLRWQSAFWLSSPRLQ